MLPWVVLAGGLFAAAQMLALKLMSEMRPAAMLRVKIVTAVSGIVFNIYGASVAGMQGITVSAVAFSSVDFLCMFELLKSRAATNWIDSSDERSA